MMDDVECEMRNVECGVWIDEWCHPEPFDKLRVNCVEGSIHFIPTIVTDS